MALIKNFKAETSIPNHISLFWNQPEGFNDSTDEIIVTRTTNHFPMELFNSSFPNRATDSRGIEIFRAQTIAGVTGVASAYTLTDGSASFPTSPPLNGRLLRDSNSQIFRILSNTSTSLTLNGTPVSGKYVILPDFPETSRDQQNFEYDVRTTVGVGSISDLVIISNGSPILTTFQTDELANLVFKDGAGVKFIIKSNTANTIYLFENVTPTLGIGMAVLNSFSNVDPLPYDDSYKIDTEAASRVGTGLEDNTFYYYTGFTKPLSTNVAQAQFGVVDSGQSTQASAISTKNRNFGDLLFNTYWPTLYRELDSTGDLEDIMNVFGFQFNELHAYIDTYRLQDSDNVYVNALLPLSEQTGLPSVGYAIGSDTLRRIAGDMIPAWKLKGSKEGIALFIKILTTWDITNGTADFSGAVSDFLPNVEALRFFDPNLGSTNVRLTKTSPFVSGGRFAKTLPGIVIPGFFTFREFVVSIPNVALYIGSSESFSIGGNTTTMVDTANNFGATNSLVGNYLLPNQEEVNDIFQIVSNTSTSITVKGIINNRSINGKYAVLSPLNTNRFIILNKLLPVYIPFGTRAGFKFVIS